MPSRWLDIHMATPQLSMEQTVVECISHSAVAHCLHVVRLLTLSRNSSYQCGAFVAVLLQYNRLVKSSVCIKMVWPFEVPLEVKCVGSIECMVCRWAFEFWLRVCWNPAWQAGCAGMHVINNTLKDRRKKCLYYCITHTHTHLETLDKRLFAL